MHLIARWMRTTEVSSPHPINWLKAPEHDSDGMYVRYDALTTLQYHKKPVPEGVTPELYRAVEDEALRRMAAIVSPRPTEQHGPDIMRLGMGQLFQQARACQSHKLCRM